MTNDVKKSAGITFTFGDPEPVLEGFQIQELMESWWNGQYYEIQLSMTIKTKVGILRDVTKLNNYGRIAVQGEIQ